MVHSGTSRHHPEIGSVALRMLWIPVIASVLVVGYVSLRAPEAEHPPMAAVAAVNELATAQRSGANDVTTPSDVITREVDTAPALPDESIKRQQELDPVGAGHDIPR